MTAPHYYALVAGVGPGTGRAAALRFAQSYSVAVLSRHPESYQSIVKEINDAGGRAVGISTDITDPRAIDEAFKDIDKALPNGKLVAAIYNVGGGFARKPFLDLKLEDLEASLDVTARGFFGFAQKALPLLLDSVAESPHPPTLIITGATASVKGSAQFGSFAAGKFALRALGQSLAREFGPRGVHVAHAIIDGVIDVPRLKDLTVNNTSPDAKISPEAIAQAYWHLHTQHRSALSQEIDIRPYVEKY
ncbi:hypothetical protein G7046_g2902 [Stylonectria norvegica]|nr:hypothetical protein G7046_g2902 [Stylonectria norvegica]